MTERLEPYLSSLLRATELGNIEGPKIDVRLIKGSFLCSRHTAITSAGQFLLGEQIRADYQRERRTPVRKGGRWISIFFHSFLSFFLPCLLCSLLLFQKICSNQDNANKSPLISPVRAIFGESKMRNRPVPGVLRCSNEAERGWGFDGHPKDSTDHISFSPMSMVYSP